MTLGGAKDSLGWCDAREIFHEIQALDDSIQRGKDIVTIFDCSNLGFIDSKSGWERTTLYRAGCGEGAATLQDHFKRPPLDIVWLDESKPNNNIPCVGHSFAIGRSSSEQSFFGVENSGMSMRSCGSKTPKLTRLCYVLPETASSESDYPTSNHQKTITQTHHLRDIWLTINTTSS
jgi:hypothetical protein